MASNRHPNNNQAPSRVENIPDTSYFPAYLLTSGLGYVQGACSLIKSLFKPFSDFTQSTLLRHPHPTEVTNWNDDRIQIKIDYFDDGSESKSEPRSLSEYRLDESTRVWMEKVYWQSTLSQMTYRSFQRKLAPMFGYWSTQFVSPNKCELELAESAALESMWITKTNRNAPAELKDNWDKRFGLVHVPRTSTTKISLALVKKIVKELTEQHTNFRKTEQRLTENKTTTGSTNDANLNTRPLMTTSPANIPHQNQPSLRF